MTETIRTVLSIRSVKVKDPFIWKLYDHFAENAIIKLEVYDESLRSLIF